MRSDWTVTLGDFFMNWKEPMTEEDIHDIEQLTDLAISAMRRRLAARPVPSTTELNTAADTFEVMLAALKHAAQNMPHPDQMIDDAIAAAES